MPGKLAGNAPGMLLTCEEDQTGLATWSCESRSTGGGTAVGRVAPQQCGAAAVCPGDGGCGSAAMALAESWGS